MASTAAFFVAKGTPAAAYTLDTLYLTQEDSILIMAPFSGIKNDVKARFACYADDWQDAFRVRFRILAPTIYIFLASALPVIAFGEQLSRETDGKLTAVQTLASTALCGIIHSLVGGQPLLILGVAEPTVIVYSFMYKFVKNKDGIGPSLFLAWAAWTCVWAAILSCLLSIFGACSYINRFTLMARELFAMLIAILFLQQAVKGTIEEFQIPTGQDQSLLEFQLPWRFGNGMFALVICSGLLWTCIESRKAEAWHYGPAWLRKFTAEYGVSVFVLIWTGISYAPSAHVPHGIPRRLSTLPPWSEGASESWLVVNNMLQVPLSYIFGALIPAIMIAVLYYFDHGVASQLAQKKFNLKKPSSYHYDQLVLSALILICGVIGVPPANGVLPQSPLHTKNLIISSKPVGKVKNNPNENEQELSSNMQPDLHDPSTLSEGPNVIVNIKLSMDQNGNDKSRAGGAIKPEVVEQRLSNILQSLLTGACLGAMPLVRKIPSSVLWGYFAFMAFESLPGNQFWERILLLCKTRCWRKEILKDARFKTVPLRTIVSFTIFQVSYLLMCFGITWIPIAGVLFPLFIMLLVPIRLNILPRVFDLGHLQDLDPIDQREATPTSEQNSSDGVDVHFSVGDDFTHRDKKVGGNGMFVDEEEAHVLYPRYADKIIEYEEAKDEVDDKHQQ
ncbi:hypothetical protein GOP47_0004087 [Adiantum capillus-veneris]|uniref:Bicarbonate transporter-like transmembrane domain-containing protein n=1 Tax=Adiantum capillus-veneris TaxID=13818 RepID=A0A9D4ZMJ0_ADICA|nr:hypothetical protein GOP47_0004087 [Adiantum capillus-veneris]